MINGRSELQTFQRKFESRGRCLTEGELAALGDAISAITEFGPDEDIVREHEVKQDSNLLLHGWTYRYSDLANGRRQILALHIDGDFVDLHSFQLKQMDHGVRTLTRCSVASVPHENLRKITEQHPRLTRLLWFNTLMDAAIMRRWMLNLGQQSAVAQFAHLLCEMYYRCRLVGLVEDDSFELPLTQTELGEALGISPVHTNRVLQQLRRDGVLRLASQRVQILDLDELSSIASFDPTYLHLEPTGAEGPA